MQYNWTNWGLRITLTTVTGVVCGALCVAATSKEAERGRDIFEKRCTGCHALDKIKVGPPLRAVFGRGAGKDAQFAYSEELKRSGVTWNEATLDRWLTDTDSVVPGNDMAFRLNDAGDRAAIVAYLRQLAEK